MQRNAVFTFPEQADEVRQPPVPAALWRARWVAQGVGTYDDWNRVRVVSLRDRLLVIPGCPASSDWLMSHLDGIARGVADQMNAPVPLEIQERTIGVRHGDDRLWGYRIPEVIVSKTATDWGPHFAADVSKELRDTMARKFERSLCRELATWHRLPDELAGNEPFLVVSQPGIAHGVPAITPERSGHGKTVSVLARRHMILLSYWRFDGDLFVGPLASLGYGRLIRCQPSELLDRYTQKALLALPSAAKELR